MKTYLKYTGLVALALFSFNIAFAQNDIETDPPFFHDITFYTVEYQKSKQVVQKLHNLKIHLAYLGVNREFDIDHIKKAQKFSLASVFNIFKKNDAKKPEAEVEGSESISMEKNPDDAVYYNDVSHN